MEVSTLNPYAEARSFPLTRTWQGSGETHVSSRKLRRIRLTLHVNVTSRDECVLFRGTKSLVDSMPSIDTVSLVNTYEQTHGMLPIAGQAEGSGED